jgi:membrane-associated phospholipid phosphatase
MEIAFSHHPAVGEPRRRVALACLTAFAGLAALVMTHAVDAADLRAELLLASVIHRLDLVGAVRDLYVSSELVFVVLLAIGIGIAWLTGRVALRRIAIEVPLALVVAEGLARLLAPLIERPRPFVAHPDFFTPLGQAGIDPSFPSDGATAAFAIAAVVAISCRRLAIPALAIAAMVAIGRLLVAVHYPTDVIGGALVGIAAAVVVCRVSRYASRLAVRSSLPGRHTSPGTASTFALSAGESEMRNEKGRSRAVQAPVPLGVPPTMGARRPRRGLCLRAGRHRVEV